MCAPKLADGGAVAGKGQRGGVCAVCADRKRPVCRNREGREHQGISGQRVAACRAALCLLALDAGQWVGECLGPGAICARQKAGACAILMA